MTVERTSHGKLVVVIVVLGIVVLGTGAFVAFKKRGDSREVSAAASREVQQWCSLRKEWAKKVSTLVPDILLKSVREEDKAEREKLVDKRDQLCRQYAAKAQELSVSDERIKAVEIALVKEGKVRANVSVEIHNLSAKLVAEDIRSLRAAQKALSVGMKQRISAGRQKADAEVKRLMTVLPGCSGIYRGPLSAAGTSGNPYISWAELDMQRQQAIKRFDAKIKVLEPKEQYANQIYHELISRYRPTLKKCYAATKKGKAGEVDILVRLKRDGKIKSLGYLEKEDEKLVDCLLEKAGKWKLPAPLKHGEKVIISIDFSKI